MDFTPMHRITVEYGMYDDGECGTYVDTDDTPYVMGLGMLEAAKQQLTLEYADMFELWDADDDED